MVATPVTPQTQRLAWLAPADISVTAPITVVPTGVAGAVPRRRAPAPTIGIRKTGPASAIAGRVIRYTIVVRNTGPRRVTGVTVRDRLPRGLVVIRSSAPYTVRSGAIVWSVGALPGRAHRTIRVWMASATGVSGPRVNVAIASARGARTVRDTAVTRFVTPAAPIVPAVTG
jgi:uncharacterized repeat protein (TIGR01451 family)